MQECLVLAEQGLGHTLSNPMVGCVLTYHDKIISRGFHEKYGQAHAEVNAINSLEDKSLLPKSNLYVNLEPCSHHGKTPPCAEFIIASGIKNVTIAAQDPNPKVAGQGIERLVKSGCQVRLGLLEEEAKNLNKRFYKFHQKQKPWILLKWAQSSDGFISDASESRTSISCPDSLKLLHSWRSQEMGILIGRKTVQADDPLLTVRLSQGKSPIRFVIDKNLQLDSKYKIFNSDSRTIIFADLSSPAKIFPENIEVVKIDFNHSILKSIQEYMYQNKIISCMVEGGHQTLQAWIDQGEWDEARVFIAPKILKKGVPAPTIKFNPISESQVGEDSLLIYKAN